MRCYSCQQPIRPGEETRKRVEFYRVYASAADLIGAEKVFGENMPDGPLSAIPAGPSLGRWTLNRVQHQKCYWVVWKRENRGGDAVEGTRPGLLDIYADDDDE